MLGRSSTLVGLSFKRERRAGRTHPGLAGCSPHRSSPPTFTTAGAGASHDGAEIGGTADVVKAAETGRACFRASSDQAGICDGFIAGEPNPKHSGIVDEIIRSEAGAEPAWTEHR